MIRRIVPGLIGLGLAVMSAGGEVTGPTQEPASYLIVGTESAILFLMREDYRRIEAD